MMNPFSTCFTKPGAIEFRHVSGSYEELLSKWVSCRQIGQIVGPHGTGKTTLLHSIARRLKAENVPVRIIQLQRAGPSRYDYPKVRTIYEHIRTRANHSNHCHQADSVLMVDGIEQLSWLGRMALCAHVKRKNIPFLATTHVALRGLPVVMTTHACPETFCQLVENILSRKDDYRTLINRGDMLAALESARGNAREAFFELFDMYRVRQIHQDKYRNAIDQKPAMCYR